MLIKTFMLIDCNYFVIILKKSLIFINFLHFYRRYIQNIKILTIRKIFFPNGDKIH